MKMHTTKQVAFITEKYEKWLKKFDCMWLNPKTSQSLYQHGHEALQTAIVYKHYIYQTEYWTL